MQWDQSIPAAVMQTIRNGVRSYSQTNVMNLSIYNANRHFNEYCIFTTQSELVPNFQNCLNN